MALETGSHIDDLVATNPASGDGLHTTDDHLRLIKKVLKASLPGLTGALLSSAGRVLPARLGSGTRDGTKFLRDDGTWEAAGGGGGVGNLTFFSLTADFTVGRTGGNVYRDAFGGNYTPPSASATVGIVLSVGVSGGDNQFSKIVRDGATDVTPVLSPFGFTRQLILDKPGTASAVSYQFQTSRITSGAPFYRVVAGSSMTIFAAPDGAVSDILTADEDVNDDGDFLEVTITPSSSSAKIYLRIFIFGQAVSAGSFVPIDISLRRGTTELVAPSHGATIPTSGVFIYPNNFEDWIDEPNTTSPVTYRIRNVHGSTATVRLGSYLMAQEVA